MSKNLQKIYNCNSDIITKSIKSELQSKHLKIKKFKDFTNVEYKDSESKTVFKQPYSNLLILESTEFYSNNSTLSTLESTEVMAGDLECARTSKGLKDSFEIQEFSGDEIEKQALNELARENQALLSETFPEASNLLSLLEEKITVPSFVQSLSGEEVMFSPSLEDDKRWNLEKEGFENITDSNLIITELLPVCASWVTSTKKKIYYINPTLFKKKEYNHYEFCKASFTLIENYLYDIISYCLEDCQKKNINFFSKKDKYVIYMHNFSGFDGQFILKNLFRSVRLTFTFDLHKHLKVSIFRGRILRIRIGALTFLDSYKLIPLSLDTLAQSLLEKSKKEKNFDVNTTVWQLRGIFLNSEKLDSFLDYCIYDSVLLLACMLKVRLEFFNKYQTDITKFVSSAALALGIFKKKYYHLPLVPAILSFNEKTDLFSYGFAPVVTKDNEHLAITITKPYFEDMIRESFFGGRAEVYQFQSTDLISADVNSCYPAAAKNPLPYGFPTHLRKIQKNFSLDSFFGFLKIEYVSPADMLLLPILPRRVDGHVIYALGHGQGWFFCEEVKLAVKYGYKIKIKEALKFTPHKGFVDFVDSLYELKVHYKKTALGILAKLMLNSMCYGKLGIKISYEKVDLMSTETFKKNKINLIKNFELTRVLESEKTNLVLVTSKARQNNINASIAESLLETHSIQQDPFNKKRQLKSMQQNYQLQDYPSMAQYKFSNSALHISSAVTSYARVSMYPILHDAYKENALIYTVTDSLIVKKDYIKKIQHLIDPDKLGMFKIEYKIKSAYFFAVHTYLLETEEGEQIIKAGSLDKTTRVKEHETLVKEMEKAAKNKSFFYWEAHNISTLSRSSLAVVEKTTKNKIFDTSYILKYRNIIKDPDSNNITTCSKILDLYNESLSLAELQILYENFN